MSTMPYTFLCVTVLLILIRGWASNAHSSIGIGSQKRLGKVVRLSGWHRLPNQTNQLVVQDMSNDNVLAEMTENIQGNQKELLGVPTTLLPYYVAFMLDSVAVGLVMPLLPFYLMELGASALQLSLVVSANYVAQMAGVLVMGKVSDQYGRRIVMLACLAASSLSYFCVSCAKSLPAVALARVISGALGGLMPVVQSAVADATTLSDRPKYLGRISATFGLGFALGPALSTALPNLSAMQKIRVAVCLPLLGFFVTLFFAKETKRNVIPFISRRKPRETELHTAKIHTAPLKSVNPITKEVSLLVLNGFLIMFAFGTETVYALLLKDAFGYGEAALSTLLAVNGLFIGLVQVLLIKPLVHCIGQRGTLMLGNAFMAIGMLGLAAVRYQPLHFVLFSIHIVAYTVAETALVSLISRYSTLQSQGRDLALNQAAQACARVFSPLIAGLLYEQSKLSTLSILPVGALPFVVGGLCSLAAVVIPALLKR